MDNAQNILVIKTVSGMAMAVAAALDNMEFRSELQGYYSKSAAICGEIALTFTRNASTSEAP